MAAPSQLDFIAALREEEEDHGLTLEPEAPAEAVAPQSKSRAFDQDFKDLKILYFGPEGLGVTHHDVNLYKTQLFGKSQPERPVSSRQVLLSDEAAVSTVDRARLDAVLNQLHFDCQPQVRGWTMAGNPETALAQHFNYGLNEFLFREFLEQQVLIRLNRVSRQSLHMAGAHPSHGMGGAGGYGAAAHSSGPPPPGPSLYVTNFPLEWTQQDLAAIFGRVGLLESVAILSGRKTFGTRGAAFVNFARQEDATRAIEQFAGQVVSLERGREEVRLNVNYARAKTRNAPDYH